MKNGIMNVVFVAISQVYTSSTDFYFYFLFFFLTGGSKATRNPHVVSVCPKARNPHVVSDCQPSNPPGPEPAGTNTHYPRIRHQRRVNFKLEVGVKHSVATWGIELGSVLVVVTTSKPLAHHPRGYRLLIFLPIS